MPFGDVGVHEAAGAGNDQLWAGTGGDTPSGGSGADTLNFGRSVDSTTRTTAEIQTVTFTASLAQRGHHIVYRANAENHCPGCGRSHWYIGRLSAECGFCGTAVPLAEARFDDSAPQGGTGSQRPRKAAGTKDQRRHSRMPANGRKLQLLIDGSPTSFAVHNISEGGAMGDAGSNLAPGSGVYVRFEGGILVPARVKWAEDGLVGLAFDTTIMLDRSAEQTN